MLYKSFEELIGRTPLFYPERFLQKQSVSGTVLCKLESFNPAGSVKDRTALFLLNDAEERGILTAGATIIEPTSGNTGIGLAALAAVRGYRLILTMPETMSIERRRLLKAYGADIVLTEGAKGMQGAIEKANQLASEIPNSFIPSQFDNPANPRAHFQTTGPEIWADSDGHVDAFVAGVGTGGTLSGVSAYLKSKNPACRVVAVEPAASPMLSEGRAGSHGLQGIGANFIPANLDPNGFDEVLPICETEAYAAARNFAVCEGLLIGISSGAALCAALQVASRPAFAKKTIVVLLPDTGERYLSTPLFEEPRF